MECVLVYLDTEQLQEQQSRITNLKRLLTSLFVHSCYIPFSDSYYGLQIVTTLSLWYNKNINGGLHRNIYFFLSIIHKMFAKVQNVYGWMDK